MKHNLLCLDGEAVFPVSDPHWKRFDLIEGLDSYKIYNHYPHDDEEGIIANLRDCTMALTNKVPLTSHIISALPGLKYIGVLATGYNVVDVEAATRAGITVTNIPAYSTASVAQMAISHLLAITNRVEYYAACNRGGKWSEQPDFCYRDFPLPELAGRRFGVVGFGNTGRATAAIAAALGMEVAVYTSKPASELPAGYVKTGLDELFATSDVVSLHCPLTPDTRNLVDTSRLAMMKPTAILINTSRGPVVDEAALADALRAGVIAAAGLDVLCQEPPEAANPLLSLPNCFISPHIAWASDAARERLFDIALGNVGSVIAGTPVNMGNR